MARYSLAFSLLTLFSLANTASIPAPYSLLSRDGGDVAVGDKWKKHNAIASFLQKSDAEHQLRFSPSIYSKAGCVPYPAVDNEGYHGAGLSPTGKAGGDCRDLKQNGQVYARTGQSFERTGTMYSYYVPKIQDGEKHKHHWMATVVWHHKEGCQETADQYSHVGISYLTNERTFDTTMTETTWISGNDGLAGSHPILQYDAREQLEALSGTEIKTEDLLNPPLVGWDALSSLARDQLNGIAYEHATVPFNDANFQTYLDAAYEVSMWENVPAEATCSDAPTAIETIASETQAAETKAAETKAAETTTSSTDLEDGNSFEEEGPLGPSETGVPDGVIPPEST